MASSTLRSLVLASLLTCLVPTLGSAQAPPEAAPSYAGQESEADLARELANPVASLISIPFQFNYDGDWGPEDDGYRLTTNIQPVVPFSLGPDWNLISRTIVPVVQQDNLFPGSGSQFGLGDVVQSLFLSPSRPTAGGLIWGVGPVFLIPTATDTLLGGEKWGVGPTAVGLVQRGPWTVGTLGNHIWSVAGDGDRADIDRSFLQPFVSYTTSDAWTYSLQSESAYDWEAEAWSVPVNAAISKLIIVGRQPISLQVGLGYWLEAPDGGPDGLRARAQVTLLFPR